MTSENAEEVIEEISEADERRFLIGFLIHDVSSLRKRRLDYHLKPLGLTRSQWWTLGNLFLRGEHGIIQSDLARLMDVKKAQLGVIIDQLEELDLVERVSVPGDRRAKQIRITQNGFRKSRQMNRIVRELTPLFTDGLSDAEMVIVEKAMIIMRENLKTMLPGDS